MKWLQKGMLVVCVLCAMMFVRADVAQAKALKEGKAYTVDLDGDGKKESVKYTMTELVRDENYAVCLYVNGKKMATVKADDYGFWASVSVVDIDKKDVKKELYVQFSVESDCFGGGKAYRYEKGTLRKYFTFDQPTTVRLSILEEQPGDGLVYFDSEYDDPNVHQGYVKQAYTISSGRLKVVQKKVLDTTAAWRKSEYKATRAIRVYGSIGDTTAKFTIAKGTVFHVYKIKVKRPGSLGSGVSYFYVKTADGKSGWVKNPGKEFFIGRYEGMDDWMEYAFQWG